jgi:hypothetical protein
MNPTLTEAHTLFADYGLLTQELLTIASSRWQGTTEWADDEEGILLGNPRVREIGESLNHLGGFAAMSAIIPALLVLGRDSAMARAICTELTHAWDGIGTWEA